MREPVTGIPGLVLRDRGAARIAWMPADIDRRYAKQHLPDHGGLLANLVRWAARDTLPLRVTGPGLIDCHLYSQPGRFVLHLVNLTSAATWRAPLEELIPVGPIRVRLAARVASKARLLVSGAELSPNPAGEFEIPSILDHEVLVVAA